MSCRTPLGHTGVAATSAMAQAGPHVEQHFGPKASFQAAKLSVPAESFDALGRNYMPQRLQSISVVHLVR